MDLNLVQLNTLINDIEILPGINDLVNVLYNENLNKYLDDKLNEGNSHLNDDNRRVILMFIIMYFYSYLNIPQEVKETTLDILLKGFLSELIKINLKINLKLNQFIN
jgi:hypothetical protein